MMRCWDNQAGNTAEKQVSSQNKTKRILKVFFVFEGDLTWTSGTLEEVSRRLITEFGWGWVPVVVIWFLQVCRLMILILYLYFVG